MGDPRRADAFADFIARNWPDPALRIADVAGGKGMLNAALFRRGFRNVLTVDTRHKCASGRTMYRYGRFTLDTAGDFDLVVGMHPDEATDVLMAWAIIHRVPFAVVPCCARPTVWPFGGRDCEWVGHLRREAERRGAHVAEAALPITGRGTVLYRTAPDPL